MDSLLGKLTDLGYELFGVVIPGLITSIFLVVWIVALGSLVPRWTFGVVPHVRLPELATVIDAAPGGRGAVYLILTLIVWYFLGHAVNWSSKARPKDERGWSKRRTRVWTFLSLHVPKPQDSYTKVLQPQLDAVSSRWTHDKKSLTWRQFYPLAKTTLVNSNRRSLLTTYQNKYTLHRSIAASAACLFWISGASVVVASASVFIRDADPPHWWLLGGTLLASVFLVTGFSATYAYYWTLWGDTVITESYALLFGPTTGAGGSDGT